MRNVRMSIFLAAILLGLAAPPGHAHQTLEFDLSSLSERGRIAYARLEGAVFFSLGPVGYIGARSREELALQELMYEAAATEALRSLCRNATTAGKLYGLLGLRKQDIKAFEQEVRLYRDRSEQTQKSSQRVPQGQTEKTSSFPYFSGGPGTVLTQSGCEVFAEQEETILRRIELGINPVGFGNLPIPSQSPPK